MKDILIIASSFVLLACMFMLGRDVGENNTNNKIEYSLKNDSQTTETLIRSLAIIIDGGDPEKVNKLINNLGNYNE